MPSEADVEITDDAELRFVSRGGLKLDGALARLGLDVAGLTCLDLGQSTGGFTDVLLSRGAKHVVGVDVGHGQLHPRLAADPRVTVLEGVNARHLEAGQLPFAQLRSGRRRPLVHLARARPAGARAAARRRRCCSSSSRSSSCSRSTSARAARSRTRAPTATSRRSCARPAPRTASRCAAGSTARRRAAKARASSSSTRARAAIRTPTP